MISVWMRFLLLTMILSCLAACGDFQTQTKSIIIFAPSSTPSLEPTFTPLPADTTTPTFTPSPIPTNTPTPTPTSTPTETLQPTNTPTPTETSTPVGGSYSFLMMVDFELIEYSINGEALEVIISEEQLKEALEIGGQVNSSNSNVSGGISPDGNKFWLTVAQIDEARGYGIADERFFVATTDLQLIEEIRLAQPQSIMAYHRSWSPNSDYLIVPESKTGSIWTVSANKDEFGRKQLVAYGDGAFWSVDGMQVFYPRTTSWYVIDREGGSGKEVFNYPGSGAGFIGAQSPSKNRLALQYLGGVAIVDSSTQESHFIKTGAAYPSAWSFDNNTLMLQQNPMETLIWEFDGSLEEPTRTHLSSYYPCGWTTDNDRLVLTKFDASTQDTSISQGDSGDSEVPVKTNEYTISNLLLDLKTEDSQIMNSFKVGGYSWKNLGWFVPSFSECPVWVQPSHK